MYNGSHSRNSYPLDKLVPKMPKRQKVKEQFVHKGVVQEVVHYVGVGSFQRQVEKKMHKKKQRQYNSFLEKNYYQQ